ncbi:MAG: SCO family protein [Spirochaetia bacterium]|nr:SCO family protein [Spirochaetia bacterium]
MKAPLLLLLAALLLESCSPGKRLSPNSIPEDSIYQLSSTWKDQTGKEITLVDLSGRIQIVGLVFTHCIQICPAIVSDMQAIEKTIPWYRKNQIHFVLLTIDPARDTPEVLASYMQKRQLSSERWTLLSGNPADTSDLAALLGIKVQALPDGSFAHSRMITVLNASGQVAFQDPAITDEGRNFLRAAIGAIR